MSIASFAAESVIPAADRPKSSPWSLSLATLMVVVTAFALGLGLGRIVWYEQGFREGYRQGFQEGPMRLRPGAPENWTPPLGHAPTD